MTKRLLILFLCVFILGSISLFAQVRGSVEGTVLDEYGDPLPGVVVKAESPTLMQPRYYTTDVNGYYRLIEMPPGPDYTIEFRMMGFQTVIRTGIEVRVNRTTRVNVELQEVAFEEQVVITGAAPVLDTSSSSSGVNVDRDFTERLPGSDSYQSALSMQGGSTGSGNPSVRGGGRTSNLYMFDGVDHTDPATATFGSNINADAVAEVEVMTGGMPAEFGRSTGGVINTVTKSGGNEFDVYLRVRFENPSWTLKDRNDYKPDSDMDYNPTLSIGGPILKDRLWFFGSYYRKSGVWARYNRTRTNWDGSTTTYNWEDEEFTEFFYGKLTWSISPSHQVFVTYHTDPMGWKNDPYLASGATIQEEDTFIYWDQDGSNYGLNYTWIVSPTLFIEARLGINRGELGYGPMKPTDDYYWVRHWNDAYTDIEWGGYPVTSLSIRDRDTYDISAKYYISDMMGSHEFKAGFSYHKLMMVSDNFFTDTWYDIQLNESYTGNEWGNWDNPIYWDYGTTRERPHDQERAPCETHYYAFYIQDQWRPDFIEGFTANIGLRFESQSAKNNIGQTGFDIGFTEQIAPRLGFVWDIGNTGKHKLNMFWGRFYTAWGSMLIGAINQTTTYWRYYDWDPSLYDGVNEESGWVFDFQTTPGVNLTTIDPDLKPDYTDEFTIGYEREITDNWAAGISYTRKLSSDLLESYRVLVDHDGNIIWNGPGSDDSLVNVVEVDWANSYLYFTNIPENKRDYWGIELFTNARIDNIRLMASYTLSEAKGTTFDSTSRAASGVQYGSSYFTTPQLSGDNIYGYSIYHVQHYIKLNASYYFPWGTSIGLSGFWRSGYHYSELDWAELLGAPGNRVGRWHIIGERGEHKLPGFYNIDLSIQQDFNFGRFGMLTLIADIYNITNNESVTGHVENSGSQFGEPNVWSRPMSWELTALYRF